MYSTVVGRYDRGVDTPIPVTVVTGFLGAGKSTLLDTWLGQLPRAETAVIVNEQGKVGIDGALLAARTLRLREITGGCICCTTQAALDAALTELAESTPPPTRILVETSGAASPAGVIRALTRGTAREQLRLDGVVTVIDAARADEALAFDLTVEQLGFADIVVMSHADRCDEGTLDALERRLGTLAPGALVLRTRHGQPDRQPGRGGAQTLVELLAVRSEVLRVPTDTAPSSTHQIIDSVAIVHDGELDQAAFGDWVETTLGAVEARILRIKGILAVRGVDQRVIVQGVGEAVDVTLGTAWGDTPRTSRLVILGLGLDEATLRAGFSACLANDDAPAG